MPSLEHTLLEFKYDPVFLNDAHKILAGKYSQISSEAKEKILEYAQSEDDFFYLDGVLNKRVARRRYLEESLGLLKHRIPVYIDNLIDEYESVIPRDEMIEVIVMDASEV